jgi:replicative DNA helicase
MRLAASAADRSQDPEESATEAIRALTRATQIRTGAVALAETLPEAMAYLQALCSGDQAAAGLSTGFAPIDRYLLLRPGELTVVGARPSVGKSSFLLSVAARAAGNGHPALLVTCEMGARELALRLLSASAGTAVSDVREGAVSDRTWAGLQAAGEDLAKLPLRIYDRGRCRVSDVVREARGMQRSGGLRLVVVDYLGLLTPVRTPKSRTKENEVAELSGDLKAAAMQLGVPLMVAAQLNRDAEGNRRPTLRHLRDSGAIEQDADNVLLLHRDRDAETVVLTIAKQRNGLAGIELDLPFDPKLTRFDGSTDDGARF